MHRLSFVVWRLKYPGSNSLGSHRRGDLLSRHVHTRVGSGSGGVLRHKSSFLPMNQCYFSYGFSVSVSVTVVIFQLQLQLLFFSFYFYFS